MVLGLSYGELFVTLGIISVILGPKDLPIIARNLGRLTGSAAAYVSRARSKLSAFAEEAEVTQLHRELQDSLHQLQAIRAELRSGISLTNPGPLTTRLLKLPPEAPAAALGAAAASAQPPAAHLRSAAAAASQVHAGLAHGPGASPGVTAAAGGVAVGAAWGGSARENLLRGSGAASSAALQGVAASGAAGAPASQLLPVSAVTVGAAPDRASGAAAAPSGADIAEDALAEERTARRAARFMASGDAGSLQH